MCNVKHIGYQAGHEHYSDAAGRISIWFRKQQILVNVHYLIITVIYMVKIYARNSVYSAVSNGPTHRKFTASWLILTHCAEWLTRRFKLNAFSLLFSTSNISFVCILTDLCILPAYAIIYKLSNAIKYVVNSYVIASWNFTE
jgi:hypothetical protein